MPPGERRRGSLDDSRSRRQGSLTPTRAPRFRARAMCGQASRAGKMRASPPGPASPGGRVGSDRRFRAGAQRATLHRSSRDAEERAPMGEAWIIDAVRTPRGKGKKDTGALSGIHPQELLAQCLNALAGAHRLRPERRRGRGRRLRHRGRRAGRAASRATRCSHAGWPDDAERRHAQPLLRLGPAGGELRRDGRDGRPAGPRRSAAASSRCRACRWAPTAAASTATTRAASRSTRWCRRASRRT